MKKLMPVQLHQQYELFFSAQPNLPSNAHCVEVTLLMDSGAIYTAPFIDHNYLTKQLELAQQGQGNEPASRGCSYFWKKNMVVVSDCSEEMIQCAVDDLIRKGDFYEVFRKL